MKPAGEDETIVEGEEIDSGPEPGQLVVDETKPKPPTNPPPPPPPGSI